MREVLKDWRGWLADWELYASGVISMIAMLRALTDGNKEGTALSAGFLILLTLYALGKGSRQQLPGTQENRRRS